MVAFHAAHQAVVVPQEERRDHRGSAAHRHAFQVVATPWAGPAKAANDEDSLLEEGAAIAVIPAEADEVAVGADVDVSEAPLTFLSILTRTPKL